MGTSEQRVTGTRKAPRFVLQAFPERYSLPKRPPGPAQAQDAHRQTTFLLGDDLKVFEDVMNLQLRIVAANAKLRGPAAAAMLTLWSRTFSQLSDACSLMSSGSYASCAPILRAALDTIAVQRSLTADGFTEYEEWLATAVSQDRARAALALDLGRYKAASALIADERLGTAYRVLMDLSMPHFGPALLLAAPEAGLQRVPASFADNSFHLGWAQLFTGWLLVLAGEQLRAACDSGVLTIDDALAQECRAAVQAAGGVLDDRRRCYVEMADGGFVLHNFRRTPAGQPKRIVLG